MNILPKFALFTVLATASVSLRGQSATDGALVGVVHDSSEAAIPSASVTVVDENTQSILQITADKNGTFQARGLRPGSYKISVAASGFATYEVNHVTVSVGVTSEIGPTLGIAGSTSTVQVMASTPPIDTESAAASFNVDKAQVSNLPINGRRWSNFVTLTPGTVRDGQYGLISFRGMSGLQNNNTVDGADNNDAFWSEERGRSIRIGYSTPQAAIQEFQVNTSDYSAAYGRAAGGVINTVTKSGTNNFHGELYLFDRDNRWGAINPFTTLSQSANGVLTTTPYKPIDRQIGRAHV